MILLLLVSRYCLLPTFQKLFEIRSGSSKETSGVAVVRFFTGHLHCNKQQILSVKILITDIMITCQLLFYSFLLLYSGESF